MSARILVFAGSIRKGSINVQLAKTLAAALKTKGATVDYLSLADYDLPVFNEDIEKPEAVARLAKHFVEADGLVIVSPEYNASLAPILKNALDWVSVSGHGKLGPYKDKMCFLAACSPGAMGGLRGLYHLRAVLMNVGAEIITPQLAVGNGGSAFSDDGSFADQRLEKLMNKGLDELLFIIKRIKAVPRP